MNQISQFYGHWKFLKIHASRCHKVFPICSYHYQLQSNQKLQNTKLKNSKMIQKQTRSLIYHPFLSFPWALTPRQGTIQELSRYTIRFVIHAHNGKILHANNILLDQIQGFHVTDGTTMPYKMPTYLRHLSLPKADLCRN